MLRSTSFICLALLASACTPTTDNSGTGTTNTPVAVATFADGQGVLRADFTETASAATGDVTKVVAFTHDVGAWVSDLSLADIEAIKVANLSVSSLNQTISPELQGLVDVKMGLITIGEETFEVYVIESDDGEGFGVIGVEKLGVGQYGSASALAIGPKATNIPTGQFTYKGINFFGKGYYTSGSAAQYNGVGDFTLTADFGSGTGALTANTTMLNTTSLTGSVTIDVSSGEFRGSNLALGGSSGGTSLVGKTADIEGSFHGNGATNVTGIYYTDNLEYGGVLVGTKQ